MRRLIAIFMIISIFLFDVSSVEELSHTDFTIHAYKIDRTKKIEFVITDALASFDNLNRVKENDKLLLDDYIPNYLGDPSEAPSSFAEMIIFSYRVAGAAGGQYTVNLKFWPFKNDNNGVITAGYTLGNVNYIFESSSTDTTNNGGRIDEGNAEVRSVEVDSDNLSSPGVLSDTWTINNPKSEPWVVRGAVALVLDSEEYTSAAYGSYSAQVIAELTTP